MTAFAGESDMNITADSSEKEQAGYLPADALGTSNRRLSKSKRMSNVSKRSIFWKFGEAKRHRSSSFVFSKRTLIKRKKRDSNHTSSHTPSTNNNSFSGNNGDSNSQSNNDNDNDEVPPLRKLSSLRAMRKRGSKEQAKERLFSFTLFPFTSQIYSSSSSSSKPKRSVPASMSVSVSVSSKEVPPFAPSGYFEAEAGPLVSLKNTLLPSANPILDEDAPLDRSRDKNHLARKSHLRYRERQNDYDEDLEDPALSSELCASLPESYKSSTQRPGSLKASANKVATSFGSLTKALMDDSSSRSDNDRGVCALTGAHAMETWHELIRPFVSDLAFCSIVTRKSESKVCFDPYTCEGAVLFVDLSGYSKITAAIAHRGAHAISSAVNAYLDRLLKIIDRYGGDVIKFAGDAVLVVWTGQQGDDDELEYNLLCASKCALDLQREAGEHPVKGTDYSFRIHCGVSCGLLESEILAAPSHIHMQRLYHQVSGQCLVDISELVDLAKSGEIAISDDVADYLGNRGTFKAIPDILGATLLKDLDLHPCVVEAMNQHIVDSKKERSKRRIPGAEEDFIHPNVLRLLRYGGLSPTQIAQMRNLCVLFIGMTSSGNSVNWLMEVQGVLDRHRCPIIQIIDDDKGTHVIAAVNLCESVPESAVLGLDACRELVSQQIGCAIGVAMGNSFCGVTGSSTIACRWDITGPHPVRAARLMQYAILNKIPVAIDSSLLNDSMAATKMTLIDPAVPIKGSPGPCAVYGLSQSKVHAVFRILETSAGATNNRAVQQIRKNINTKRSRCAVILTGAPFTGKKLVCQKAAALSNLVPFLHTCNETAGLAQLARTIAQWYLYTEHEGIKARAMSVLTHMDNSRWTKAHDECVDLVYAAVEVGLRACFVIDRIQFLDSFSMSILRGCLEGREGTGGNCNRARIIRMGSGLTNGHSSDGSWRTTGGGDDYKGKVVFLGCHLSVYNRKTAEDIQQDITRSRRTFRVRVVEVDLPTTEDLKGLIRDNLDVDADRRWVRCLSESSGVSAAYFLSRAKNIRKLSKNDGAEVYDLITSSLKLHIPAGAIQRCRRFPLGKVSADMAMKTLQLFDDLPPLFQTLTKVLAVATRRYPLRIPYIVVWKVMNDLYGEMDSSLFATVIREMKQEHLLKTEIDKKMDKIIFQCPIVAEVALNVCTPNQITIICEALLDRLEALKNHDFLVPMVMAELFHELGKERGMKECWILAYKSFLQEPPLSVFERDWWKEQFSDTITSAGYDTAEVLGKDFAAPDVSEEPLPQIFLQLRAFQAEICYGPLAHTLQAISRNIVLAFGAYARGDANLLSRLGNEGMALRQLYSRQVGTLEGFLAESRPDKPDLSLDEELELVDFLTRPSDNAEEVVEQAQKFLVELINKHVLKRKQRLRAYVSTLSYAPDALVYCSDEAILAAYEKTLVQRCWKDTMEDALMILAVKNWKPTLTPECQPLPAYTLQTICRLRDMFLKQEVTEQIVRVQKRYAVIDFQTFLISTALIHNEMHGTSKADRKSMRRGRSDMRSYSRASSFQSLQSSVSSLHMLQEEDASDLDASDLSSVSSKSRGVKPAEL